MMIFNLFKQLANVTGLPPIVSICALVIILSLTLFGILIIIKIRSIKKVLNNLNSRLDTIGQRVGLQSEESENTLPHKFKLGAYIKNDPAAEGRSSIETNDTANLVPIKVSGEYRPNAEIRKNIYEFLKKSSKPTPYHELTKHLSKDYPGYNYDFFLKEAEDLQKEGKVEVQLVAGKLYFQINKR